MRSLPTLVAAAACAVSVAPPLAAAAQKVVPVNFQRSEQKSSPLQKRATITQSLDNNITGSGYYASVAAGTPPQNLSLIIDTGSSDTWVLAADSDLCQSARKQKLDGYCLPTYDSSASSTYNLVSDNSFNITYVDQSGATGDYIKDDFSIGGITVSQLQMGLATNSTIPAGIMGIGFDTNEATRNRYPNLIDDLINQGLIGAKAYSLYLNDYDSSTGTILFGGIDTEKFIGQLTALKLVNDAQSGEITSFTVALNGLSMSVNGSSTDVSPTRAIPVVLDSGTTLTYLPSRVVEQIYDSVGAQYDGQYGLTYIDCKYLSSEQNLSFAFQFGSADGPIVSVPADELVFDEVQQLVDAGYDTPPDLGFSDACIFGLSANDDYYLLGDTFLRSAYVVYDLQNLEIAIAQANLNSTDSNVVEISNSSTQLPDVTGVASQVSVTQTATGLPGHGGGTTTAAATTTTTGTAASGTATNSGNAAARGVPAPDWSAVVVAALSSLGVIAGGMIVAL